MVDEELGAKPLVDSLEQAVWHRRAGEAEFPDRAGIGSSEVRMADEIVIKRRNEIEIADALALDQPQRLGSIEARQADKGAVDHGHCQQRADAHRVT
jgi:hypothetical protein